LYFYDNQTSSKRPDNENKQLSDLVWLMTVLMKKDKHWQCHPYL